MVHPNGGISRVRRDAQGTLDEPPQQDQIEYPPAAIVLQHRLIIRRYGPNNRYTLHRLTDVEPRGPLAAVENPTVLTADPTSNHFRACRFLT